MFVTLKPNTRLVGALRSGLRKFGLGVDFGRAEQTPLKNDLMTVLRWRTSGILLSTGTTLERLA